LSTIALRRVSLDNPMINSDTPGSNSIKNPSINIPIPETKQQVKKSNVNEVFSGETLTQLTNQIQYTNKAFRTSLSGTPYGTEDTALLQSKFDDLEKNLTSLMTEKTSLMEESEKLHQRGGKTLKERTRLTQVELRLKELGKDISNIRKELTKG